MKKTRKQEKKAPPGVLVIVFLLMVTSCIQGVSQIKIIPNVPDLQQPIAGSIGNPVNNACAPVSAANITLYWDSVYHHSNAFMVNDNTPPNAIADYLFYFMDTNNWGSPSRANGTGIPFAASKGTYNIDIQPGFYEYVKWDSLNPFTTFAMKPFL